MPYTNNPEGITRFNYCHKEDKCVITKKDDNKEEIKDGKAANPKKAEDYVQQYKIYDENSFDNILLHYFFKYNLFW